MKKNVDIYLFNILFFHSWNKKDNTFTGNAIRSEDMEISYKTCRAWCCCIRLGIYLCVQKKTKLIKIISLKNKSIRLAVATA